MRKKKVKRKKSPINFNFEELQFEEIVSYDYDCEVFENYYYTEIKTPLGKIRYDKFRDCYYTY